MNFYFFSLNEKFLMKSNHWNEFQWPLHLLLLIFTVITPIRVWVSWSAGLKGHLTYSEFTMLIWEGSGCHFAKEKSMVRKADWERWIYWKPIAQPEEGYPGGSVLIGWADKHIMRYYFNFSLPIIIALVGMTAFTG